ncbi:MAG: O-antigen ligase family protein [Gemmatimonadaceae bacterium]|nr:O-antigen ligase family protein [Gloeobacterales cyanobacterium ES-bin-141]
MLRLISVLLTFLYCFVWLRVPEELFGVALPLQRMVGLLGLAFSIAVLASNVGPAFGKLGKLYLSITSLFVLYIVVDLPLKLLSSPNLLDSYFDLQLFASDLVKYGASFASGFVIYYTLRRYPQLEDTLVRLLILSGSLSVAIAYILLLFYYLEITIDNTILANSFGGYLGVWGTGELIPRLAGTAAEPQQFAIIFMTPLLLMLSHRYISRLWPVALVSVLALVISQSKFSIVSLVIVISYVLIVYKQYRQPIGLGVLVLVPPIFYYISTLPIFSETLSDVGGSGAIVERAFNAANLVTIITGSPITGIGAGQYGPYIGYFSSGNKDALSKTYYPSFDYLKILAETGIIGFSMIMFLFIQLLRKFITAYRRLTSTNQERYLAFLLGGVAIALNMFIGYEFLHVFFWINVGFLLAAADQVLDSNSEDVEDTATFPYRLEEAEANSNLK